MFSRLCLTAARLFLCLWVGGALLFVITSIAEQRFPGFTEPTKNQLALIRFPWYYRFGFVLVAGTLVLGHGARRHPDLRGAGRWIVVGCVSAALALMLVDYFLVYQPLAEMITPPDRAMPSDFHAYHQASKWINLTHVGLSLIACVPLCRPAAA